MPSIADLIAETEQQLQRLQIELAAYKRAAAAAAAPQSNGQTRYSGPSEAVAAYLAEHGPTSRRELIAALEGRFDTDSANPQRSLTQAITAGLKRGTIRKVRGKLARG